MQREDKRAKAKKGRVAVKVGLPGEDGELHRFEIPISYLYHPFISRLLNDAHEVYGYHFSGPLTLPCSVDDFLHIRWLIERESASPHNSPRTQRHGSPFSFQSCR